MMMIHRESLTDKVIKMNWYEELGNWVDPLYNLLESDYIDHLVTFIEHKYNSKAEIYPPKKNLFKPFYQCDYTDFKVVIIGNNAPLSKEASGIGFGMNDKYSTLPSTLGSMKDCIKETIYGSKIKHVHFDTTLEDIAGQGVLFLNTSMTTESKESHEIYWKKFIRTIIQHISKEKENIVFAFINSDNDYLKAEIDNSKHLIVENTGSYIPAYSQFFVKIDEYINSKYGKHDYIQW